MREAIKMPYQKGQKFLIEIEANSDGEFIGSELLSKLFSEEDRENFTFTQLVINVDGFHDEIKKQFLAELIDIAVDKGVMNRDSFPNGIF